MKTPNDYAIDEVKDYIYHIEEMSSFYGLNLEQQSFSKWAAIEIIKCLKEHTDVPPLVIIESFREEMYMYACSNKKTSFIFSIAVDVANHVDDILVSC